MFPGPWVDYQNWVPVDVVHTETVEWPLIGALGGAQSVAFTFSRQTSVHVSDHLPIRGNS